MAGAEWFWVVLLALVPALAPTLWLRLALVVPACARRSCGSRSTRRPPTTGPGSSSPCSCGSTTASSTTTTSPSRSTASSSRTCTASSCSRSSASASLLAQFVAARRPLPAVLTVLAGAGWPATLYPVESVFYGALILAAALWVLAGLRTARAAARPRRGSACSCSPPPAPRPRLRWRRTACSPGSAGTRTRRPGASRVSYVWDASYGGIEFPKQKTTVLRIVGPKRGALLARDDARPVHRRSLAREPDAALDRPARRATAERPAPAGSLAESAHLDQAAGRGGRALATRTSSPRRSRSPLEAPQLGGVFNLSDGIVRVYGGAQAGAALHRLQLRAAPEPAQLARVEPAYPAALDRFLQIGRTQVEPFGAAGRDERVDQLFDDERYLALWPYEASGTRRSGSARARGRRTGRSWRSRPGCARPAASTTTRRRRRPAACRRSRTSWPRASAATASTSPARWP